VVIRLASSRTFAEIIQRGAATEDEVVAVLDLREEQPVLAARMFPLSCGEEGREVRQPLLTAGHQIPRGRASWRVLAGDREPRISGKHW
jgi:hypothetical protein